MPSSHIGSEAMLIWMKYPAWSMISVRGAVRTMRAPRTGVIWPGVFSEVAVCIRVMVDSALV
jgi:hypothetical protein